MFEKSMIGYYLMLGIWCLVIVILVMAFVLRPFIGLYLNLRKDLSGVIDIFRIEGPLHLFHG